MKAPFIFIIIIVLGLFGAVNYYIGLRIWQYTGTFVKGLNKTVYWVFFWIIASSYLLTRNIPEELPDNIRKFFSQMGGYWMAAMLYFTLLFLLIDLVKLLSKLTGILSQNIWTNPRITLCIGSSVLLFVMTILAYGTFNARNPVVRYQEINIGKRAGNLDKLHIVAASDLHLGIIVDRDRLVSMVDKINSLKPDIVLLPGDVLDNDVEIFEKQEMWTALSRIKTHFGVYASLGNHEHIGSSKGNAAQLLEKSGVKVLKDNMLLIENSFYIIGREDLSSERFSNKKRQDLATIINDADKALPLLLMDHQPSNLQEAENNYIDLQISGHTHKGQIFPGNLITGLIYEIDHGYLKKGSTNIFVTSGLGTWGPPLRLGTRSEILDITVKFNTQP